MRITSKGQVTIPARIREQAGLLPNTEVEFEYDGESVRIVKAKPGEGRGESRGDRIVRRMWKRSPGRMSTDEIMALMRGDWRDDQDGGA